MKHAFCLTLLGCLTLALPASIRASGCYVGRPCPPPARVERLDNEKYEIGKRLFTGKTTPQGEAGPDAASQQARLTALQGQLPKSAAKKANLPALAGKLSASQMAALEYYLQQRYKLK